MLFLPVVLVPFLFDFIYTIIFLFVFKRKIYFERKSNVLLPPVCAFVFFVCLSARATHSTHISHRQLVAVHCDVASDVQRGSASVFFVFNFTTLLKRKKVRFTFVPKTSTGVYVLLPSETVSEVTYLFSYTVSTYLSHLHTFLYLLFFTRAK